MDPQPRAQPVRGALPPLRGAVITDFKTSSDGKNSSLSYKLGNVVHSVNYADQGNGTWRFEYVQPDGNRLVENYQRRGAVLTPSRPVTKQSGSMVLASRVVSDGGQLPQRYTGSGLGISPPLQWSGVPEGTKSCALSMHHVDREGRSKWYWTLYNIPGNVRSLDENSTSVGVAGNNSINRLLGYAPPHSKGPGAKQYVITLYALSTPLQLEVPPQAVSREVLLTAMQGKVLSAADLHVICISSGSPGVDR